MTLMRKYANSFLKTLFSAFVGSILFFLGGYYVLLRLSKSKRKVSDRVRNGLPNFKSRKDLRSISPNLANLGDRLPVIIEKVDEQGKITMAQLSSLFPNITTRTLRRDMNKLVEKGMVKRNGTTRSTVYFKV